MLFRIYRDHKTWDNVAFRIDTAKELVVEMYLAVESEVEGNRVRPNLQQRALVNV